MMELDEAIKHAEEVANEKERLGAIGRGNPDKYAPSPEQCFKCAAEHRQLAEWLKELKWLREQKRPHGEWIADDWIRDVNGEFYHLYACSNCGFKAIKHYPFCVCGADMRKKEGDENG